MQFINIFICKEESQILKNSKNFIIIDIYLPTTICYLLKFILQRHLDSLLHKKAGIVTVSLGTSEIWIGQKNLQVIYEALKKTSFTIFWKASHEHLKPKMNESNKSLASQFKFLNQLPLNDILSKFISRGSIELPD